MFGIGGGDVVGNAAYDRLIGEIIGCSVTVEEGLRRQIAYLEGNT